MSVNKARSRVANEIKKSKKVGAPANFAAVQDVRRALPEEKIRAYVERTVASAPPLTQEQRERLTSLGRGV